MLIIQEFKPMTKAVVIVIIVTIIIISINSFLFYAWGYVPVNPELLQW